MAGKKWSNPFAFMPMAVSIITVIVYLAIAIPLIIIHETVPPFPTNPVVYRGLNITEAWLDLAELSNGYHPYNSHRNDKVRDWLLTRIEQILEGNGIAWSSETTFDTLSSKLSDDVPLQSSTNLQTTPLQPRTAARSVVIFNDMQSNVSFSATGVIMTSGGQARLPGQSVYFEGTNIMVYIRGKEDEDGDWWKSDFLQPKKSHGKGGVLISAHYDSVSTGFGATDDGVGVVTILQLIRYFTTPSNQPQKGIVALLNNGEEDFLNGARAYTQHPISDFAYTFLNVEGAGAGGRATLLRTTDTEVTRAYATCPNPFGTIVTADSFKMGVVRSQTDYVVYEGILGLRGLDLTFWRPRARYHTDQDDARHTNMFSLWDMLSASLSTMKYLTSDTSDTFLGPRGDGAKGKVKNGSGTDGVWFDIFGKVFPVFGLRTLFAWSLSLLIASPLVLILIIYLLIRKDKLYYFSSYAPGSENGEISHPVSLQGWRGFFRFPVTLVVASGLTIASAYLIAKVNPLIVYSSRYAVWTMMLTLNFTVFWFIMRGADVVRPSALHRGYAYLWMFCLGWAILVATTVFEDRFKIASGYLFVILESAIFLVTIISLCELFALPTKEDYGHIWRREQRINDNCNNPPEHAPGAAHESDHHEDEPTETTPLFGGDGNGSRVTTFANYSRRSLGGGVGGDATQDDPDDDSKPYGDEQGWSRKMPTWTWLLQFLLLAPFWIIILGQVGLLAVEGVSQTGPDGSSLLLPHLMMALLSILLLLPLAPIYHRFTYHIPTFLFLVFIATLVYSLVAFPFSENNRYKAYFQQIVNLETGQNEVILAGLDQYVLPIATWLPSTAGQVVKCTSEDSLRPGVKNCRWRGIPPRVVPNTSPGVPPENGYADWLTFNVTRNPGENSARFEVSGQNTRACVLRFDRAIKDFNVLGSVRDDRFDPVPEAGSLQIKLWHREWDTPWIVDVEWPVSEGKKLGEEGMEGKVVCLWSDNNVEGVIPALDEMRRYMPPWAAVTKAGDGLVEGWKGFIV